VLHVGLDLSRRRVDVCLISSEGEPIDRFAAMPDRDGLYGLASRVAVYGEPVRGVVESEVERESRSTSKSTVSELFIELTRTALQELMSRRLVDVRLAVTMLDGLKIADRTHVVALGISTDGVKIPLGLWEGSTRTPPSPAPCWLTWSTGGWIPSRRSSSSSTAGNDHVRADRRLHRD
jgi:hypothetical protein